MNASTILVQGRSPEEIETLHIHTAADPRSTAARDFMSGVRLFDKALEEAERVFKREDVWFLASTRSDAGGRGVVPLNVFLRPVLTELTANPRFADGFAAALGDYLVTLNNGVVSGPGPQYDGFEYAEIVGPMSAASIGHHFMAGRDLAVEMLREAQTVEGGGAISVASIEAQYREGKPQVNFVQTYLDKIRERPELAEGFAAVLSDCLTVSASVDVYAGLSYPEITG